VCGHVWSKTDRQHLGEEFVEAMNQANQPKVLDFLGIRLLAQEHHVRLVQEIETLSIQRPQSSKDLQDIPLDHRPRRMIETTGEPVRPRGFVRRHLLNYTPNLILRKSMVKVSVNLWHTEHGKVDVMQAGDLGTKKLIKELEDGLSFIFLGAKHHAMVGELGNMIFATTVTSLKVKEFGVGVALMEDRQPRALSDDGSGQGG
jgi:hypothetical protein